MSDPRQERRVDLGKRTAVLRYDMNAICELEEAIGGPVTTLLSDAKRLGFREIRALVWAGMLHGEPTNTLAKVGAWIDAARFADIAKVAAEALSAALKIDGAEDDDSTDRGEPDPT